MRLIDAPRTDPLSRRTAWDLTPNRLAAALAASRHSGLPLIDLTQSNPTRCGFAHPGPAATTVLADPAAATYRPEPRGLLEARAAVARYYAESGVTLDPARLILTASTSEAYSFLFKLLTDPGDRVLIPRPSYPLFDDLTRLDGAVAAPYALQPTDHWLPDLATIDGELGAGARALLMVSPNNPTGSVTGVADLAELADRVAAAQAALISDEVFADFPLASSTEVPVAAALDLPCLTFSLNGLSKICGLPQMKLAWIAVGGPPALVDRALARLEVIADTYLSVSTPVQLAANALLTGRGLFQEECRHRLRTNLATIDRALAPHPSLELLRPQAGWYACIRVPTLGTEEDLALALLEQDQVHVHPGFFYDFPAGSHMVISLLGPTADLQTGLDRILARVT